MTIAFRGLRRHGNLLPLMSRDETRYARMAEPTLKQLKEIQAGAESESTAPPRPRLGMILGAYLQDAKGGRVFRGYADRFKFAGLLRHAKTSL